MLSVAALLSLVAPVLVHAQSDEPLPVAAKRSIEGVLQAKARRTPAQRKVSSQLLDARRAQVRDAAGNAAEGLSNDPVRNATPDTTPPTISIVLSPGHGVPLNTAITATVTLDNLDPASYSSLVFRADLTEWDQAFARSTHCEGKDTGKDITVEVDASRETIAVEVWKSCSQDIYAYFTLDAALFRLDTSAPGGRVELASAETRFAMSRYLQAGQTAPPPPAPGVAAWLDPDPTSFEWKVGESVVFRVRTDILQYLNHHVGVRGYGSEDGARFADDTNGLDAEEACRNVDDGIVDWRRAIHQPVRFVACRAGEATIRVWHETDPEVLSTYEFRIRPADDDEAPALAAEDAATVRDATLTLTFDEALATANTAASAFAVTGGTTRTISGVAVNGSTVQLTIDPPILYGESGIEVDYTAPSREALADAAGNKVVSFEDRAVSNETPATTLSTGVSLSLDTPSVSEGGSAKSVALTAMLNRSARPAATAVTVEVGAAGDTATEGTDYAAVDDLTLTIPAYMTGITVRFTLTPMNDRIDEPGESLTVTGSTAVAGLTVTPPAGLALDIEDNDAAPSLALSVSASAIDEDGGTAAVTVSTGSGSTYATDQTVRLAVAGTATEAADYVIDSKALTLAAGTGTSASMATATVTGLDDSLDDDDETIEITGSRNGVAFGSRQTIAIEDDDWPELTVAFRQADYRVSEGEHVDLPVTLSAVPERQVTIPIEIEVAGGAEAVDYSVSPASLTFGASETDKTLRVRASNDSVVDPGEGVTLSLGTTLPERISEGGIAETTVAIRDTDFTFAPAFAAGAGTAESDADTYTVSEASSALRLSLTLKTPRGARVVDVADPVVVTLATRENAGGREADEDYATQRRSGTFGDYGALHRDLSFAPGDFSDDATCGCARAERTVAVDLFDDRVRERTEVFGLKLSRRSERLSVSSQDVTVRIDEDDAEPALTLGADPGTIAEAGGTSTVTVSTGSGSTFPTAQTIDLDISGTATENTDFDIDAKRLTLPAGTGMDASSVSTAVRALDDAIDDDAETIVLSALRGGTEFENRTLTIIDDETGSTRVDLSVNPAQVREDAGATTVRLTATLDADARAENTEVTVTVGTSGDSAVEGTDYQSVADLTLTIDAGETTAEDDVPVEPDRQRCR